MSLSQCSGQSEKCFSRSGGSGNGYKFYVGIKDCIHCKGLFLIAWRDAIGSERFYKYDITGIVVVPGQNGITVGMTEVVKLVAWWGFVAEGLERDSLFQLDQLLQHVRVCTLYVDYPFLVLADTLLLYVVCKVVLHKHSNGLGLHPKIYILCYKGYCAVAVIMFVPDGSGQDPVVLCVIFESVLQIFWKVLIGGYG